MDSGVLGEYERLASVYERRWAAYLSQTTEETLRAWTPQGAERVLDVGCGTGYLLAELAARNRDLSLHGLDPSPGMLAVAGERLGDSADLVGGVAENLPWPEGHFETVYTCSALHYWSDPVAGMAEILRVLAPGGRLVLTDWRRKGLFMRGMLAYLRRTGRPPGTVFSGEEVRALLVRTGFRDVVPRFYRAGALWRLMTLTAGKPPE